MKLFLSILFLLLSGTITHGQACDTIYRNVTVPAQYKGGNLQLLRYVTHEVGPILKSCMPGDEYTVSRLHIVFTIDDTGKVIEVSFPKPELSTLCKEQLKQKLMTMQGWTSGKMDGRNVCSTYFLPISCLKWQ